MDNIEAMVNPTSIFLLGITNIMFLLAKIHPSTFWGHFLIFHQTSQKKFHFFSKNMLGVGWGLSEKCIWRRAHICQECMIYIIGQENVLLKQARGDRTLKMQHFWKNYEKVFWVRVGWGLSKFLGVDWGLSGGWLGVEKILSYIFFKNGAFSRFCHP